MTVASGKCLCGAVKFTAEAVQTRHHACHCGMCRHWAGGPLLAAAVQGLLFQGEENLATFQSSDWAERGFCKRCSSNLFYHLQPAGQYMMCVGSFDDPTVFKLDGEIFVDQRPEGQGFAGDLPQYTEAEFMAKFVTGGDENS